VALCRLVLDSLSHNCYTLPKRDSTSVWLFSGRLERQLSNLCFRPCIKWPGSWKIKAPKSPLAISGKEFRGLFLVDIQLYICYTVFTLSASLATVRFKVLPYWALNSKSKPVITGRHNGEGNSTTASAVKSPLDRQTRFGGFFALTTLSTPAI